MPLRRPRRIFRSGSLGSGTAGPGVSPALLAGLLGAAIGAAVVLFSLPSALFGRVPLPSGVLEADAPQIAVVDGETLRLRETVVRLQGVLAPPRGRTCRDGQRRHLRLRRGGNRGARRARPRSFHRLPAGRAGQQRLSGRPLRGRRGGRSIARWWPPAGHAPNCRTWRATRRRRRRAIWGCGGTAPHRSDCTITPTLTVQSRRGKLLRPRRLRSFLGRLNFLATACRCRWRFLTRGLQNGSRTTGACQLGWLSG